jgi:hypothetical protein
MNNGALHRRQLFGGGEAEIEDGPFLHSPGQLHDVAMQDCLTK